MKPLFVFMFLAFQAFELFSQTAIKIEIYGLRNSKGVVYFDFRNSKNQTLKTYSQKIEDNSCCFFIANLEKGKYSFKFFHDENGNQKLDSNWLGIPNEGFGFSNNAMGRFGPPDFIETLFEVKSDTIVSCKMRYFNF